MAGFQGLNATGKSGSGTGAAIEHVEFEIQDNYGTAIYAGDPVTLSSGFLIACAENASPIGVLKGVRYIDAQGQVVRLNYYPASTTSTGTLEWSGGRTGNVVAEVIPADNHTFLIDISDAALAQADIGNAAGKRLKNTGTQVGSTGRSAAVLDNDASVTSELRLVRILRVAGIPGNGSIGSGTDTTVEVEFVESVGDAT